MALAYTALFDMAYGTTAFPGANTYAPLWKKSAVAVSVSCVSILSESAAVTNHADRLVWAYASLKDIQTAGQQMLWFLLQDATISANGDAASDLLVQSTVNSLVDTLAG